MKHPVNLVKDSEKLQSRLVLTMFLIIIGIILYALSIDSQPVSTPSEVKTEQVAVIEQKIEPVVVEQPVQPVATPAPAPAVRWQDNPNKCNTDTQYIWASDFSCHDKPVNKPVVKNTAPKPAPTKVVSSAPAGCDHLSNLLQAKGIVGVELDSAIKIASKESGCNPNAVNKSSGACSYFQELTCGKWGGTGNVDAHINGAINYARSRYGSFAGAWASWQQKHWW